MEQAVCRRSLYQWVWLEVLPLNHCVTLLKNLYDILFKKKFHVHCDSTDMATTNWAKSVDRGRARGSGVGSVWVTGSVWSLGRLTLTANTVPVTAPSFRSDTEGKEGSGAVSQKHPSRLPGCPTPLTNQDQWWHPNQFLSICPPDTLSKHSVHKLRILHYCKSSNDGCDFLGMQADNIFIDMMGHSIHNSSGSLISIIWIFLG